MNKWSVKRIALSALLIAVMLILGYIESLIPLGPVPGIKLGLSNSVLLLGLCWLGIPATFVLMFAKVLLSGLLFSEPVSIPRGHNIHIVSERSRHLPPPSH